MVHVPDAGLIQNVPTFGREVVYELAKSDKFPGPGYQLGACFQSLQNAGTEAQVADQDSNQHHMGHHDFDKLNVAESLYCILIC